MQPCIPWWVRPPFFLNSKAFKEQNSSPYGSILIRHLYHGYSLPLDDVKTTCIGALHLINNLQERLQLGCPIWAASPYIKVRAPGLVQLLCC